MDLFRAAEDKLLKDAGWFEAGGTVHCSLMWRDPATGSLYTREEALKVLNRRAVEHESLRRAQEEAEVREPEDGR